MKNLEQIDILLAVYNGQKYIEEQINSILNQTYSNFRLIISDDCSNDDTIRIIKELAKIDNRIILYEQKKNLGYVKNFEFLLTKVQNELYMLSDQDDVWLPCKVENSYKKLKEENADLVFTDLEVVNENLEMIYPSFNDYMKLTRKIKKYCDDYRLQYLYNCITGCTILSKKEFLKYVLPIPKDSRYVIHDTWIGLIVSLKGKISYLDEKTIKYRQHSNNQLGIKKQKHNLRTLNKTKKLFIDVKIDLFKTYVNNKEIFSEELNLLNVEALNYFKKLKNKRMINLKDWTTFYKLYKYETIKYFLINFLVLNM